MNLTRFQALQRAHDQLEGAQRRLDKAKRKNERNQNKISKKENLLAKELKYTICCEKLINNNIKRQDEPINRNDKFHLPFMLMSTKDNEQRIGAYFNDEDTRQSLSISTESKFRVLGDIDLFMQCQDRLDASKDLRLYQIESIGQLKDIVMDNQRSSSDFEVYQKVFD